MIKTKEYKKDYIIYSDGRVWSNKTNKFLSAHKNNKGYVKVVIRVDGKRFYLNLHRALAECFIPNPNNYPFINHINGIKSDNRLENLEWCTNKQNMQHFQKMYKDNPERWPNYEKGKLKRKTKLVAKCGKKLLYLENGKEIYFESRMALFRYLGKKKTSTNSWNSLLKKGKIVLL